jgi:hypothetical protein
MVFGEKSTREKEAQIEERVANLLSDLRSKFPDPESLQKFDAELSEMRVMNAWRDSRGLNNEVQTQVFIYFLFFIYFLTLCL